jgi:hypothetical protein
LTTFDVAIIEMCFMPLETLFRYQALTRSSAVAMTRIRNGQERDCRRRKVASALGVADAPFARPRAALADW